MEKIRINDYHCDAIRVILRPEELITMYSYSVSGGLSLFIGLFFRMDGLYVDVDYITRVQEVFEDFGITPELKQNKEFYATLGY